MKVITIVGTRPELIKLSQVIKELDKYVDHIFVHTGQNHDYELNKVFFEDLDIREPDYYMDAVGVSSTHTIANIMIFTETLLENEKPDAVLILGDTNSCLSAYVAKRKHIPIFHMEAGNRCFDERVPEEINRKIIDHISDINLVYTEHARRNLLNEGLKTDQIIKTGSPMKEVLDKHWTEINQSNIMKDMNLHKDEYYLVSCHREENVDDIKRLMSLYSILNKLGDDKRVIVSTHPRLRKMIDEDDVGDSSTVTFCEPFGFFDYCNLQQNAYCVVSDSGTITEESSLLGFPAVTIRQAHERPEGMDMGTLIMSDLDIHSIRDAIKVVTTQKKLHHIPDDYDVDIVSQKIVRLILSYTGYINRRTWYK